MIGAGLGLALVGVVIAGPGDAILLIGVLIAAIGLVRKFG